MKQALEQVQYLKTRERKNSFDRWVVALRTKPGLSNPMKTIVQVNASSEQDAKVRAVRKVSKDKKHQFRGIHCFIFDTVQKAEEQNGNASTGNNEGDSANDQ